MSASPPPPTIHRGLNISPRLPLLLVLLLLLAGTPVRVASAQASNRSYELQPVKRPGYPRAFVFDDRGLIIGEHNVSRTPPNCMEISTAGDNEKDIVLIMQLKYPLYLSMIMDIYKNGKEDQLDSPYDVFMLDYTEGNEEYAQVLSDDMFIKLVAILSNRTITHGHQRLPPYRDICIYRQVEQDSEMIRLSRGVSIVFRTVPESVSSVTVCLRNFTLDSSLKAVAGFARDLARGAKISNPLNKDYSVSCEYRLFDGHLPLALKIREYISIPLNKSSIIIELKEPYVISHVRIFASHDFLNSDMEVSLTRQNSSLFDETGARMDNESFKCRNDIVTKLRDYHDFMCTPFLLETGEYLALSHIEIKCTDTVNVVEIAAFREFKNFPKFLDTSNTGRVEIIYIIVTLLSIFIAYVLFSIKMHCLSKDDSWEDKKNGNIGKIACGKGLDIRSSSNINTKLTDEDKQEENEQEKEIDENEDVLGIMELLPGDDNFMQMCLLNMQQNN